MRFKRRCNEVDAIQYKGDTNEIQRFVAGYSVVKEDFWTMHVPITLIQTCFGVKLLNIGDYVVKEGNKIIVYNAEEFNDVFMRVNDEQ